MRKTSNKTNSAKVMKHFNDKLDAKRVAAYKTGGPVEQPALSEETKADMLAYGKHMADAESVNAKHAKNSKKIRRGKRSVKAKF